MSSFFFQKMALSNIKKNSRTYIPYILTCIGTILMFYNMCSLTFHIKTGDGALASIMMIGAIVIGIFSTIFLFYTNSFLIKQRKKEFGLLNILGLEKKHIGFIIFWETFFVSIFSILIGLLAGILTNKLFTLLLYKLLSFDPKYGFEISNIAIIITVSLFLVIFILNLLKNIIFVCRAKPIELLSGGNVGEKEPKTKWLLTLIGIITLGIGYYFAITIKSPVDVLSLFFVAVILVMIGTYCLFTAGSIALLKLLRKNKSYYYKTKHFTAVSGMIYRMKQNAVGLANICILATAVIVVVSTTVALFIGIDDSLNNRYPSDISIETDYTPETIIEETKIKEQIKKIAIDKNREIINYNSYTSLAFSAMNKDNEYITNKDTSYINSSNINLLVFITADEYERLSGQQVELSENEMLFHGKENKVKNSIKLFNEEYKIKENLVAFPPIGDYMVYIAKVNYFVVQSDAILNKLYNNQLQVYGDFASPLELSINIDTNGTDLEKIEFGAELNLDKSIGRVECKQEARAGFYELYGGLFFLGIFLGTLFLMATVLIIYYKQIAEGYEDKMRFNVMQKVGMSKKEVKKSISSQILTVFFIPLIMACVHIVFAFPLLEKLLVLLNLTNSNLFVFSIIGTTLIFILIYAAVFMLTAKVYYRIVNQK